MIRLYFLLLILSLASTVKAQQPFRFTQYFQNTIAINPAVAGSEDFLDVKLGYRQQWTGLEASPQTLYVSAHAPLAARTDGFSYRDNSLRISDPNLYTQAESGRALSSMKQTRHGVGGYVLNDQQDVFQQTLAFATYAAHFPIGARTRLAVGLSGGLRNTQIDLTRLSGDLGGDPTFERYQSQDGNVMKLDLNVGLFLYSESYFVGYSATQLLNQSLYPGVDSIEAAPSIYHYGLAGLRFNLNSSLLLMPGVLVGYDGGGVLPLTLDANVRLRFKNLVWAGVSYRNTQTLAGMLGFNINNQFNVNYAYDYGLGGASALRSGTHEIVLGFTLFNHQESTPYLW